MADKDLLDSIKSIMDDAEQRIAKNTAILMETEFKPKFDILAEGQKAILDRIPSKDDLDIIDSRITTLEAVVKKLSREISELKKANKTQNIYIKKT